MALHWSFGVLDEVRRAQEKYLVLRQHTSVDAYATEFQEVCNVIPDLSREDKIFRFIHGLKPHIKTPV